MFIILRKMSFCNACVVRKDRTANNLNGCKNSAALFGRVDRREDLKTIIRRATNPRFVDRKMVVRERLDRLGERRLCRRVIVYASL